MSSIAGSESRPTRPGSRRRAALRSALAVAAGGIGAGSLPPLGWWPLGIVAFAGLGAALGGRSLAGRAVGGACFGLGLFVPSLVWVTEFHAVGYLLLVVLQCSFFAAAAAAVAPGRWALALPGAVVLAEAARSAVPFGGLPLGGLALGQVGGPLAPIARIGTALAVVGATALGGVALLALARRRLLVASACLALVVAAGAVGAALPGGQAAGTTLRAAAVQGGGPRGFRAVDADAHEVFERHVEATRALIGGERLDLVVWPENGVDVSALDGSEEGDILAGLARALDTTLVVGVTEDAPGDRFRNVAVAWTPEGRIVDRYVKAHRVPFGEYVPGRALLSPFVDLSVLPRDAVAGHGPAVLRTPAGPLGVAISYEVFFPSRARAAVTGGQVLLVPTNAASFRTSQVPTQEVAAAQLRAWETGRWVVQAAPTGYSAVIDDRGRVRARSTLGRRQVLVHRVPLLTGRTLAVRAPWAPVLLAALVVALGWLLEAGRRRGERAGTGDASDPRTMPA